MVFTKPSQRWPMRSGVPKPIFPKSPCDNKSPTTSDTSSMPATARKPIRVSTRSSKNTPDPLPISLVGWKPPFSNNSPFLHFLKISAVACEPPTCAKLSTPKSNAEPEWLVFFQTKPPSCASFPPSLWTFPRSGTPAKPIFSRTVITNPNQKKTFGILQAAYPNLQ